MSNFTELIKNVFNYNEKIPYDFVLPHSTSSSSIDSEISEEVFSEYKKNYDFIQSKYSTLLNDDIKLREFNLNFQNKKYKAFLFFIDGMINSESINRFVLDPLMLKAQSNTSTSSNTSFSAEHERVTVVQHSDIQTYIMDTLLPQNDVTTSNSFSNIFSQVNSGVSALFVDTLNVAFLIDAKGFDKRSVSIPENEYIIRGPQEAFIEALRTNTSLIRRIINNENLIIENLSVGNISNTTCSVCYMKNIANSNLVAEVKYRINNISIDSITSSGELEQLIQDSSFRCSSTYFY
jgi:spore germination protein KA